MCCGGWNEVTRFIVGMWKGIVGSGVMESGGGGSNVSLEYPIVLWRWALPMVKWWGVMVVDIAAEMGSAGGERATVGEVVR